MSDRLRVWAFAAYLFALLVILLAWAIKMLMGMKRKRTAAAAFSMPVVWGTLLQALSPLPITMGMSSGSLRPSMWELAGVLVLAPLGAALFIAMMISTRGSALQQGLATRGPFALVRHPMYLAFLMMVLATGMVVSARWTLLASVAIYIFGTEMRIRVEEAELAESGRGYAAYRDRVRWRYLPGLR